MGIENDGGHAFPTNKHLLGGDGMSLRDYFASTALQGLLAGRLHGFNANERKDAFSVDAPEWAAMAYAFADAMLKERAKI